MVHILKYNLKEPTMNGEQQIITKKTLQVKLHQFLNIFRYGFSLPEYKFIVDIVLGILKSRSIICNRIAQELAESITKKKTCERLSRNLSRDGFGDKIQQRIIDRKSVV